jgi:uncharacterized OB-fold protein
MASFGSSLEALACTGCGHVTLPPIVACPACMGRKFKAERVDGKARLVSWTIIRKPPEHLAAEGAYVVCVADFDGRIKVTGRLPSALIGEETSGPALGSEIFYAGMHRRVHRFELSAGESDAKEKQEVRTH